MSYSLQYIGLQVLNSARTRYGLHIHACILIALIDHIHDIVPGTLRHDQWV